MRASSVRGGGVARERGCKGRDVFWMAGEVLLSGRSVDGGRESHISSAWERGYELPDWYKSLYTKVFLMIYDSGLVSKSSNFSPRGTTSPGFENDRIASLVWIEGDTRQRGCEGRDVPWEASEVVLQQLYTLRQLYRGTSLIRKIYPPRITIGP